MAFVIKYYRDGKEVGSTPWFDTLVGTKNAALDGLIRHQADTASIIDDSTGKEAALVKR